ncbi:MAG: sensor histidine kinase, partial [Clostridiaceae bacterium]|nr:sensor histidine kinase [Clostridiaceae bacterium]
TMPFWPYALFGLAIPAFEGMLVGKPWYLLPSIVSMILCPHISITLVVVIIQAGFFGGVIRGWLQETQLYRREADQQRRYRYELEGLKSELLEASVQGTRMAELTERNRIAQELHDSVGHEITAAVLAFQAFEQLWREEDPMAEEMFNQGKERLSKSALQLRETVHNMKPMSGTGVEGLGDIINGFTHCPIDLNIYGDTSRVPTYLWTILQTCLKEALTNVIRHAHATKVAVSLDVSPHIVRLSIFNDGDSKGKEGGGIGLRNLRQRAKAVGGSVSVDTSEGFHLICVLPIEKGN